MVEQKIGLHTCVMLLIMGIVVSGMALWLVDTEPWRTIVGASGFALAFYSGIAFKNYSIQKSLGGV